MLRFTFLTLVFLTACLSTSVHGYAQQVATTEGNQFLFLSTGPGATSGDSGFDRGGVLGNEGDVAIFSISFPASSGQTVSYDYNFLTAEAGVGAFEFNDYLEVNLNGTRIQADIVADSFFPLPFFNFDGNSIIGAGSNFFAGQRGFLTDFATTIEGINTLEFFIGDEGNFEGDSALLVDNISLDNLLIEGFELQTDPTVLGVVTGNVLIQNNDFSVVPEPSAFFAMLGLGVVTVSTRRRS